MSMNCLKEPARVVVLRALRRLLRREGWSHSDWSIVFVSLFSSIDMVNTISLNTECNDERF